MATIVVGAGLCACPVSGGAGCEMKMAKKGWLFYSFSNLGYKFKRGEPSDLIYCMDTLRVKGEDKEQYFGLFEESGWTHVSSVGDSIHFFLAPVGTKPIYTDRSTLIEKYRKGRNDVFRGAGVLGVVFMVFLMLEGLFTRLLDNKILSLAVGVIAGASLGMTLALIVTGIVMNVKVGKLCR